MVSKREIVSMVLEGKRPPYVPWSFRFTKEAEDKLQRHLGSGEIPSFVKNHLLELGSDIGFFTDLGDNLHRDVFGVTWDRSIDKDIGDVRGSLLAEPTLEGYEFPDPLDRRFFSDIEEKISNAPDCFRLYCLGFSLFERAWTFRGMENLMMDFILHPDFVHTLMETIADYNIAQIKEALNYDIDAVYFGDDWGQQQGLLMGYTIWKEFIQPQLKRMYGVVKGAGKRVFIHSCGDVRELFDDLIEIGVDCFNPFQPEVMDIHGIYKTYSSRLSFWGGLSVQKTLPFGTPDEVKAETQRLIAMGREGRFILSPSHSVTGDVSLENMLTFIESVQVQPGWPG